MLTVDCLPNAVGKQPSMPLINLGRKWHKADDDDDDDDDEFNIFQIITSDHK